MARSGSSASPAPWSSSIDGCDVIGSRIEAELSCFGGGTVSGAGARQLPEALGVVSLGVERHAARIERSAGRCREADALAATGEYRERRAPHRPLCQIGDRHRIVAAFRGGRLRGRVAVATAQSLREAPQPGKPAARPACRMELPSARRDGLRAPRPPRRSSRRPPVHSSPTPPAVVS